ncbi:hypothetical protein IWW55_004088 [Coemansia sp. RSA 2706]|nr:hypothetical protein LPJ63_004422 [Coemansia sp. RSA 2711]KAJ1836192.1 hypothetical protein LPJ70_006157 [Coemansia sp. RSA 2708]KAJ2299800.1 hypothetical protein IWW55_004088 [Coemansia sp. RSA 2706]KAJ2311278.1 hypothetical protein IWW54_002731 [Coemansia sp. RSA 2705]KAJ2362428.1 hypothetical protein H4S01_004785 [Coemansia sp. RSA 2610]KAJ2382320.1 hypothetical protein H4S02_005801 [Coemansia sp. RSA 2611]
MAIEQSKRVRLVQAVKRIFGRAKPAEQPVISAHVRMSLALAIAEQYVLVSQDYPSSSSPATTLCGSAAASPVSGYKQHVDFKSHHECAADEATLAYDARKSLLSFVRPRTASALTVCEGNECCSPMVAAREMPLCC